MTATPTSHALARTRHARRRPALAGVLVLVVVALLTVLAGAAVGADGDAGDVQAERLAGEDRKATAAAIATDTFASADTVLVSRADDFADAVAGNYYAGVAGAPILLADPAGPVPSATWEALEDLDASEVVLLGGPGALSEDVADEFRDAGYEVARIAGGDRWETARDLALAGEGSVGVRTLDPAFPDWEQTFDEDADEWAGSETEGPVGWCGTTERFDAGEGPVEPSVGEGYAVATGGACNDFWAGEFGEEFRSGPYAAGTPFAEVWPRGGYTMELDVHLDADEAPAFDYQTAISLLDVRRAEGTIASIRYFEVPVTTEDGTVEVFGHEVDEDGWHTFRHEFTEDDEGRLHVEFKLLRDDEVVLAETIDETGAFDAEPGTATSAFDAGNVGGGYVWLHLDEGAELAIDAYRVAAAFPGWQQAYGEHADEWVGSETDGQDGWCGTFERFTAAQGPVAPSVGDGYVLAEGGACNEFWAEEFGEEFRSGPFPGRTPLSQAWPRGGFVMEVDVHLDPDDAPTYDHYTSISLLDVREEIGFVESIRYFGVPVATEDGAVSVLGHELDDAGWHTFRHEFTAGAGGELEVTFSVWREGEAVLTESLEETGAFDPEPGTPTSDFAAEDVGSGYFWPHLDEGATVAFDDYRVAVLDPVEEDRRTAILARGDDFADALVAGGAAYAEQFPVLLTAPDTVPEATDEALADEALDIEHVIVSGGPAAISDEVVAEIEASHAVTTERVAGPRRTATATEWADFATEHLGWGAEHANLARGDLFPDALTMGPHVGEEEAALLLTPDPDTLAAPGDADDPDVRSATQWLEAHACELTSLHVAGGASAVSDAVVDEAVAAATGTDCAGDDG